MSGTPVHTAAGQSLSAICLICCTPSAPHKHYGAVCCYSCRIFFRRGVGKVFKCIRGVGGCPVDQFTRTNCKKCRFQKCLQVGMVPALVDSFVRIKPFVINDVSDITANPKQVKVIQMKEKPCGLPAVERRLATKPPLSAVCGICTSAAAPHKHYGAVCCYSCRIFFRRGVGKQFRCIGGGGNCATIATTGQDGNIWNNCKKCRFDKCLEVGMIPGLVDSFTRMKQQEKHQAAHQLQVAGQIIDTVKKEEEEYRGEDTGEHKVYGEEEMQENVDNNKKTVLLQLRDIFPVGDHLEVSQSSENTNNFIPSNFNQTDLARDSPV